jgi:hypothetical protein
MFRIAVSALALAAFGAVAPAAAQRKELSIVAGGTLSGAVGQNLAEVTERPGFVAGLSVRVPRADAFSFETALLVVQRRLRGRRPSSTQPPLLTGPLTDAANLVYLQAPFLLRFHQAYSPGRPVRPWLVLGPYIAARLFCNREVAETTGITRQTDCSVAAGEFTVGDETFQLAVYQAMDFGFVGGVGVDFRRVGVGLRFERSVRNLVEPGGAARTSPLERSNLWAVSFSLEYVVRVW